jgi:hypothetical protein
VKTVFYDIEEAGKAREPSSLEYYGPDGNLTLGISYTLDGDDLAFGYLDGYRVSKEVLELRASVTPTDTSTATTTRDGWSRKKHLTRTAPSEAGPSIYTDPAKRKSRCSATT